MKDRLKIISILTVLLTASVFGCKDDENDFPIVYPSNLQIDLEYDTAILGKVNLVVSAQNANFYTIVFNEGGEKTFVENKTGDATYTYTTSGQFPITIRANSTTEIFTEWYRVADINLDTGTVVDPGIPTTGYTTPLTYPNYTLVFQDEFDGNSLNMANWTFETGTGNGGWGNNELQYYLERNLRVGEGVLTIEAKDETFNTSNYTSSRIKSEGKKSFQYGRIDIRAAMPEGQGLWPALWMLGDDISSVGWPKCGEIDIMEMAGGTTTSTRGDGTVFGTLHWERANGLKADASGYRSLSSGKLSDEFHVYSIIWDSQKIEWYLDDVRYHVIDITPADMSEFHQKFFFILNVAVGGTLPGSPNSSTVFPQKMYVDYIRVFQ